MASNASVVSQQIHHDNTITTISDTGQATRVIHIIKYITEQPWVLEDTVTLAVHYRCCP